MIANESNIPIQEIKDDFLKEKGVQLFIKREDLIHPEISGNKWRKLKYNISEAITGSYKTLLTFGGAYSNHIAATAAAGKLNEIPTHGIIRGERVEPLNPTLALAEKNEMTFTFISREDYRKRFDADFINEVAQGLEKPYVIPEGGANLLGMLGCEEITDGLDDFDVFSCALGTGSTFAGIVSSMNKNQIAIGFPILKQAGFMVEQVQRYLYMLDSDAVEWDLYLEYHFGGYAKQKPELISFIQNFWKKHEIKLDPIYTAKAMFGLFDLIKKGELENKKVLFVHTGGLQGVAGFEERYKVKLFE